MRSPFSIFLVLLCLSTAPAVEAVTPAFAASFGRPEAAAMVGLMEEIDKKSAKAFRKAKGTKRIALLSRFWDRHCPIFSRLYVDFQLGQRRPNASAAFYNDPDFLTPDYWVYAEPIESTELSTAILLLENLIRANPEDGVARIALGYCLLETGQLLEAESTFIASLKQHRREPAVYNGLGLSWVKRQNGQSVGRDRFREALALDRSYEAASYNLAMSQIATRATDVPFHIRKVTKRFPDHSDVFYKLGVWHEIRSRFANEYVQDATDAYVAQTRGNPEHYAAWSNLARMKMRVASFHEAVSICRRVLEEAPVYRVRVLPILMEAYQGLGKFAEADSAAQRYVKMLNPQTRHHFEDIRLIASREETKMLDALSGQARDAFVEDYWKRHDPTPGSLANEKWVEHVRRVGNAMVLYSEAVQPWDKRGEVYIRYGDPQHKSRSDNMRFEVDPYVVRVRDRLLNTLSDEERLEIRQFHRRIRTSTRDVQKITNPDGTFSIEVSDFEPAEFGSDPKAGDNRFGAPAPSNNEYQRGLIESINDRIPPVDIRGVPLFPVEGNRPWEYWVYTDVGPGIEVVFSAFNQHGGFGFAAPPQGGRKISRFNELTFRDRRPEHVIARAITRQPSLLRMPVAPMAFVYDSADFRGHDGTSLLEVHVGRVAETTGDTISTAASMIVYDKHWNAILESHESDVHIKGTPLDTLATTTFEVDLNPGQYILALQIDDPTTGRMGAQRMGIEVESYRDTSLMLSDVAFASEIVEDADGNRNGVRLVPNPWRRYGSDEPVLVYYEIYGLADDAFGQNRYRVDYELTPLDGGALAARVVRGLGRQLGFDQRESTRISYERVGEETDEFGYIEIDLSGSRPGPYEVSVTITDAVSGDSVTKRSAFSLIPPAESGAETSATAQSAKPGIQ